MHRSLCVGISLLPLALGFSHLVHDDDRLSLRQNQQRDSGLKPNHFTWTAPGEGDLRAPCPVLNTLANHEFLPHDGRNITLDKAVNALGDALNIAPALATTFFNGGLRTNPTANATVSLECRFTASSPGIVTQSAMRAWFDFDMLHKHNVLEHDGSLSRQDMYFNTSNLFDADTFDAFLAYFGDADTLEVNATADARARHANEMSKINPEFTITQTSLQIMVGEAAMMLMVWGSVEEPVANRTFFEYFFRNERLPVELGWAPGETEIGAADATSLITAMVAASPSDVPLVYA